MVTQVIPTKLLQVRLYVYKNNTEPIIHTFYGDKARDHALMKAHQYAPYNQKLIETMERVY